VRVGRAARRAAGSAVAELNGVREVDQGAERPGARNPRQTRCFLSRGRLPPNGARFCCGACGGSRAALNQKIGRGCRLANAPAAASAG